MTDAPRRIQRQHNTFDAINDRPIFWTDANGITHKCEGADVHAGTRLLWTLCEQDVPANSAFLPGDGDAVSCVRCHADVLLEIANG